MKIKIIPCSLTCFFLLLYLINIPVIAAESTPTKSNLKEKNTKINGSIVLVDANSKTVFIEVEKVKKTIAIDNATKIKVKGVKDATINDLRVNQKAKITYCIKDGKVIAVKIVAKPVPVIKKEESPKEKEEVLPPMDMGSR